MAGLDPATQLSIEACVQKGYLHIFASKPKNWITRSSSFFWRANARQMDGRLKGGHDGLGLIPINPDTL